MTNIQRIIINFVNQNFVKGALTIELISNDCIKITDKTSESMTLSANIYCDIFDCSTKKRIAVSDLPHTLDGNNLYTEPKKWINLPQ